MKILNLHFENINNLKGRHSISFESEPLVSAGIFAIIGPTGSGKSSILDVITLALFNRIPRFKGGITSSKILDLGSVVTHHTSRASAEIEYEINNKKYLSKWSIEQNRNGKLKDYEMSIQLESGEYLDLKRPEVPKKNEEIIGLNYDQFIKSIILSQGQFSKFLKSDKNERGQLLENLTGTSIYRKIGQQAFFKYRSTKNEINIIEQRLEEIQVLSDDEKSDIDVKIKNLKTDLNGFEKEISQLAKGIQVKTEINEIKEELSKSTKAVSLNNEKKATFREQFLKLEQHDKISPLRVDLSNYHGARNTINQCQKDILEYSEKSKTASDNLSKVITDMSSLTKSTVSLENFKSTMSAFEKEVNTLDNELEHLKINGKKVRNRLNEKLPKYPMKLGERLSPKEIIASLDQHRIKLLDEIHSSTLNEKSDIQRQRSILTKEKERISLINLIIDKIKALEKLHLQYEEAKKKIIQFKKQIEELQQKTDNATSKLEIRKQLYESLLQQKVDAIKIESLESRREDLVDGEPCPLCGAIDHPYSEHRPKIELQELEQKILKSKNEIQHDEASIKEFNNQITRNQANIEGQREFDTKWKVMQEEIESEVKILCEKEEIDSTAIKLLSKEVVDLEKSTNRREIAISALETLKLNLDILQISKELSEVSDAYKSANAKRQNKFSGQDVSKLCNDLQDQFNNSKTIIATNKEAISLKQNDLNTAQNKLNQLEEVLNPNVQLLGFESIEAMGENLLEESIFLQLKKEKEGILKEETSVKAQILPLKSKLEIKNSEDSNLKISLEELMHQLRLKEEKRDQLNKEMGQHSSVLNQNKIVIKRRKAKEKELKVSEEALEKWSFINRMIGDASGNKFANFAQALTLQNLLVLTNKRLRHLSERYILDKPSADGELRVIDQYQGNTERAISTLSGGETFIISLALALSLSDMASRNVSIDSLFIDEGFGTLDQETLEIALDTLERLQTESQKMVGVISHVTALKERINVQIKLQKNAQGFSSLIVES